jgi:tetratricopeptide (TPR) repeat protein
MEGSQALDFARGSQPALFPTIVISFLLAVCCLSRAQTSATPARTSAGLKELFNDQRWAEVVREAEKLSSRTAETEYYYGSALAQLGRWDQARRALLRGRELVPKDKRFPIELGGVAYKQRRYREAAAWLRRGLQIDPDDSYASEFLATIYFVQGNMEAALKYWNRIDKPFIEQVQTERELKIDPALLDRAFTFAPASVLRLPDLLATDKRLQGLGVFGRYHLSLAGRDDGKFDVKFQAAERNAEGGGKWGALLAIFRGLPYQTIYPEYFNIGGEARNFSSLVRWDAQKRRVAASFSSPLEGNPRYRYELNLDLRNENWEVRPAFTGPSPLLGALNLRREAFGAGIRAFDSGRWGWSTGAEFSHRGYRDVLPGSALDADLLSAGYQLKHVAEVNYELLRIPEQRFSLDSNVTSQVAVIWSNPRHTFEKLQGRVSGEWFPQMQGDDYRMRETVRAGTTLGRAPFDELFMLGLERDNDLWMRAHIGTLGGRKGSAPLGGNYLLSNWEIDKNVYSNGIFGLKLSPFLDAGRVNAPTIGLGSRKWLWDTGMQVKASVLGVGVTFIYGKDLRSGNNAFYVITAR